MTSDPYTSHKTSTASLGDIFSLPVPVKVALWVSPSLAIGAWTIQAIFRFTVPSRGSSLTAVALVLGVVCGGITALCAGYQLIRRPDAWNWKWSVLLVVNAVLLLIAVMLVPNLLTRH
jgi:hypothetical protein